MTSHRAYLASAAVAALLFTVALSADAQTMGDKLRLTAFAVNLNAAGRGDTTSTVEITIDRWTPDAVAKELVKTLADKGPEALLDNLHDQPPVGRIRTPDSLGYDLRYAQEKPGEDGGRTIVLATDRPIGYWEAVNQPRSIDYPFTVIEIRLNSDGTGEGKMSFATKITAVGNDTISLENYEQQPVYLKSVRVQK
jgi:hypothetical protein